MATVNALSINYSRTAVGVSESPQFSWVIESSGRNCVQKAYQLQIAEDEEFTELLTDTGLVAGDSSAHVRADGFIPRQGRIYWARVRVKTSSDTQEDCLSAFSSPAKMIGALEHPDSLKARFITVEDSDDIKKARGYLPQKRVYGRQRCRLGSDLLHCTG